MLVYWRAAGISRGIPPVTAGTASPRAGFPIFHRPTHTPMYTPMYPTEGQGLESLNPYGPSSHIVQSVVDE